VGERRARNAFDRLRPVRRLVGPVEAAEARWFGRSLLSLVYRTPVLVLETTGRRTGRRRQVTLACCEIEGDLVVVGGAGGQSRLPDWVANLRADPKVTVTRRRRRTPMRARELHGDERAAMWRQLLPIWPQVTTYEERAGYEIAVVVLQTPPPPPL
jgi:deazaflavin-dependent oxidoreductase (nitroreductase family)